MVKNIVTILVLCFFCACSHENKKPAKFLFPVKEFGQWGYIDTSGKMVIRCQFDAASEFSDGLAAILQDSLYGFIDATGSIVIPPQFHDVRKFSDGLCHVTIQADSGLTNAFIRKDGSIAFISQYEKIEDFSNGRAMVEIGDKKCYVDKNGNVAIQTHLEYASPFHEGIAQAWGNCGTWMIQPDGSSRSAIDATIYFDTAGKILAKVGGMGHEDFSEGLALVTINGNPCYLDKSLRPQIWPEQGKWWYSSFSDGLARVVDNNYSNKTGFMDKTGKIVIPAIYDEAEDFKEGLAAFWNEQSWGFINKKGEVAIQPQFQRVDFSGFKNGLCGVLKDYRWGLINHQGEFVWKEQTGMQYEKLDFSKWKLDTLSVLNPVKAEKNAGWRNYPRKKSFPNMSGFTLKIDTMDITVFNEKYFAYKLYLINSTQDTVWIPVQDGRVKIIQQAMNKKGEWQDIENFVNSFCGNSYYNVSQAPGEYQVFPTPIYKGEFKTRLRFRVEMGKEQIYSNEYSGHINYGQFLDADEKDKTKIAVWAE